MRFFILVFLVSFAATGCGSHFDSPSSAAKNNSGKGDSGDGGSHDGGGTNTENESLGICGSLKFDNIVWPKDLNLQGKRALALALNISGSFEGSDSWSTISDNFDGQGVSLGLLQQNLGQGSLQPLLIRIRDEHPELLTQIFTPADRVSLLKMLSTWEDEFTPAFFTDDELFPDRDVLSPLDQGADIQTRTAVRDTASVTWAKKTLYSGGKFIPRWKTALMTLANTAAYRSLQVERAKSMFDRSEAYFNAFQLKELRSFLLMYDFVVQNGSLNATLKKAYDKYLKANPSASETARDRKILELRLSSVSSRFRNDVKARKNTIIDSVGTVHGDKRNLPKENCYNPNEIL